ncbi:nicotinate-nucleotide--dimethylbenzimidazole phosphoribosyltransferase, partial [Salmonella enterica subsp. enterica serovar Kentucky]|nr:nicotinate-nucleotide--dimethylbenzimidazole phosphoribosyltransferase [Salmonella enterica subsp. enterica serovar Kentucky]
GAARCGLPVLLDGFLSYSAALAACQIAPAVRPYLIPSHFSAEMLRGIEAVTDAHGYQTMLAHYGYKPEMEQERLESMLSWNIDGL